MLATVATLPPLVAPSEVLFFNLTEDFFFSFSNLFFQIERLRFYLAQVQRNEAFLIHAGDCAEAFDACIHQNISAKIGLILSFSLVLIWGARLPVVRIGRIAGQYAKPRSSPYEQIGDRQVLSFRFVLIRSLFPQSPFTFPRGDIVNGFDPKDRTPDPERLLRCVNHPQLHPYPPRIRICLSSPPKRLVLGTRSLSFPPVSFDLFRSASHTQLPAAANSNPS